MSDGKKMLLLDAVRLAISYQPLLTEVKEKAFSAALRGDKEATTLYAHLRVTVNDTVGTILSQLPQMTVDIPILDLFRPMVSEVPMPAPTSPVTEDLYDIVMLVHEFREARRKWGETMRDQKNAGMEAYKEAVDPARELMDRAWMALLNALAAYPEPDLRKVEEIINAPS